MINVQTQYRADLDGLRAIAVWLVVLYHAGFEFMPGGFIGVDIFFVLSGFLISSLLLKGMQAETFSYKEFYLRRFRRLIPAYLVVAIFSLLVGWFILIPSDFIYHTRMMGLALLSVGNFYIANTTGGYFDAGVENIALLHTWSLSVEEQFYLLWPMLLLWMVRSFKLEKLPLILFVASVFLLAFSQWYAIHDSVRAYYLLPARAFELMMGAFMAVSLMKLPKITNAQSSVLAVIGLTLIVSSALLLSKEVVFPGLNAFYPCLGTAILIYTGLQSNFAKKILETRLMVFNGKISYSLYLWHWVVFTFIRYVQGEMSLFWQLAGIAFSVAASWATLHFIENPFRFRFLWSFKKTFLVVFVTPLVVFALLTVSARHFDGFIERFDEQAAAIRAVDSEPVDLKRACHHNPKEGKHCDVLLFGDSHALHFGDFLKHMADDAGLTIVSAIEGNCQPLYGVHILERQSRGDVRLEKCDKMKARQFENLDGYKYVVLGGYWEVSRIKEEGYFYRYNEDADNPDVSNEQLLAESLEKTVQMVLQTGAVPVLIRDIPILTQNQFRCSMRRAIVSSNVECDIDIQPIIEQQKMADELIDTLAAKYHQVMVLDVRSIICEDGKCRTDMDGIPLYMDNNHLNAVASAMIGDLYMKKYGNIFLQ